jgi:hypothetical protein
LISVTSIHSLKEYYEIMMRVNKFFLWAPRILSIGFVIFISIFALDVFSNNSGFEIILPLFMHLLPSLALLITVIVAWKYKLVGAIIFFGFAGFYIWSVGFGRPLSWYLAIAFPSFVAGILYFISWIQKRNLVKSDLI